MPIIRDGLFNRGIHMDKTNFEDVKNIVKALLKKDRRNFVHRISLLYQQAYSISPLYRDFICKVINSSSLKIKYTSTKGYFSGIEEKGPAQTLNRRCKNLIEFNFTWMSTLPHELGHAVDFWFGTDCPLTSKVDLGNNKSFYDIFTEEFNSKKEELYKLVVEEYKNIVNSNINENAYDILTSKIDVYRTLNSIPCKPKDPEITKRRKELQDELYESGFVEVYYQLKVKKCTDILNEKYSPILDALSSEYNFECLGLAHHRKGYYNAHKTLAAEEFFANAFSAEIMSNVQHFDNLRKYLPNTFNNFFKLFQIFYQRIQNNNRFTDVKLVEEK